MATHGGSDHIGGVEDELDAAPMEGGLAGVGNQDKGPPKCEYKAAMTDNEIAACRAISQSNMTKGKHR
jgi:hypothetical protein